MTGTYHPTQETRIYLNGRLENEVTPFAQINKAANQRDWGAMLGIRDSNPQEWEINGHIDEFKYFYRVLSTTGQFVEKIMLLLSTQSKCSQTSSGYRTLFEQNQMTYICDHVLTHITFKARKIAHNKIPHRMVHQINKEPPCSTAASMARPEVLPY